MGGKYAYFPALAFLCWTSIAGSQVQSPFKLKVDVDLTTIEVTALGKDGKPVPDLEQDDFHVYVDGKQQDILSFDVVREKSAMPLQKAPLFVDEGRNHGKAVLIVFDDSRITPENTRRARDSAEQFVLKHMQPQDLFAVAYFDRSLRIQQNLTDERNEVLAALKQPSSHDQSGRFYFEELMASLERMNHSFSRVAGRKAVLLYSQMVHRQNSNPGASAGSAADAAQALSNMRAEGSFYRQNSGAAVKASASAIKGGIVYHVLDVGGMLAGQNQVLGYTWPIAKASGGSIVYNANDMDSRLDDIGQEISNYYILGFRNNNTKLDGGLRSVEVKTDRKGLTLHYRRGYQDRCPIDVLASSKKEEQLIRALSTPGSATQLPVNFRAHYFYDKPLLATVILSIAIQPEKISLKRKGDQMTGSINLMGVAYAEDGSIAARFSEIHEVSCDKETQAEFRKGNLYYRSYFKLRPGKYHFKLAASDGFESLGSREQQFQIPEFPVKGIALSSLVLARNLTALPDLIRNLRAGLLDQSNPLIYSGVEIEPSVETKVTGHPVLSVLFRIYNLPNGPRKNDMIATAGLSDKAGRKFSLDPIHLGNLMASVSPNESIVALRLPFSDVPPGKYTLEIEISENSSANTARIETDIELLGTK